MKIETQTCEAVLSNSAGCVLDSVTGKNMEDLAQQLGSLLTSQTWLLADGDRIRVRTS